MMNFEPSTSSSSKAQEVESGRKNSENEMRPQLQEPKHQRAEMQKALELEVQKVTNDVSRKLTEIHAIQITTPNSTLQSASKHPDILRLFEQINLSLMDTLRTAEDEQQQQQKKNDQEAMLANRKQQGRLHRWVCLTRLLQKDSKRAERHLKKALELDSFTKRLLKDKEALRQFVEEDSDLLPIPQWRKDFALYLTMNGREVVSGGGSSGSATYGAGAKSRHLNTSFSADDPEGDGGGHLLPVVTIDTHANRRGRSRTGMLNNGTSSGVDVDVVLANEGAPEVDTENAGTERDNITGPGLVDSREDDPGAAGHVSSATSSLESLDKIKTTTLVHQRDPEINRFQAATSSRAPTSTSAASGGLVGTSSAGAASGSFYQETKFTTILLAPAQLSSVDRSVSVYSSNKLGVPASDGAMETLETKLQQVRSKTTAGASAGVHSAARTERQKEVATSEVDSTLYDATSLTPTAAQTSVQRTRLVSLAAGEAQSEPLPAGKIASLGLQGNKSAAADKERTRFDTGAYLRQQRESASTIRNTTPEQVEQLSPTKLPAGFAAAGASARAGSSAESAADLVTATTKTTERTVYPDRYLAGSFAGAPIMGPASEGAAAPMVVVPEVAAETASRPPDEPAQDSDRPGVRTTSVLSTAAAPASGAREGRGSAEDHGKSWRQLLQPGDIVECYSRKNNEWVQSEVVEPTNGMPFGEVIGVRYCDGTGDGKNIARGSEVIRQCHVVSHPRGSSSVDVDGAPPPAQVVPQHFAERIEGMNSFPKVGQAVASSSSSAPSAVQNDDMNQEKNKNSASGQAVDGAATNHAPTSQHSSAQPKQGVYRPTISPSNGTTPAPSLLGFHAPLSGQNLLPPQHQLQRPPGLVMPKMLNAPNNFLPPERVAPSGGGSVVGGVLHQVGGAVASNFAPPQLPGSSTSTAMQKPKPSRRVWTANAAVGAPPAPKLPAVNAQEHQRPKMPAGESGRMQSDERRKNLPNKSSSPTTTLATEYNINQDIMIDAKELEFRELLGSGGFGSVHRGYYRSKLVAIKKLYVVTSDQQVNRELIEEFAKEVKMLAKLQHERLVGILGACATKQELCMVLEYMPRGNLHNLLHVEKFTLAKKTKRKIVLHIIQGIAFLHAGAGGVGTEVGDDQHPASTATTSGAGTSPLSPKPIVHRDLKSMNVVLDHDFNAKLCDFGLTQSMEKTHITRKEQEGGSPRYMAPELFDAAIKLTEKVDIWAVGCLIAEIFLQRSPHEECTNLQQVMGKLLVQKKSPFATRSGLKELGNPLLEELVTSCLQFEPRLRTSAQDLLAKFEDLEVTY
ncbi:unnamed protein product [Amoebophrya sp. A120]|nr:unnamed protein product [Amoebophrya sp. A120]|eukprot:GSA120T00006085001.1